MMEVKEIILIGENGKKKSFKLEEPKKEPKEDYWEYAEREMNKR